MELLVNDCSLHGQFQNLRAFRIAIAELMEIRRTARRYGRELHCHRNFAHASVTPTMILRQAVSDFSLDEQRALMHWLTTQGPFWEDARTHAGNEWLECDGDVVTDTAVGEAAFCVFQGIDRRLISIQPSVWNTTPLAVKYVEDSGRTFPVQVENLWSRIATEAALETTPLLIQSWRDLQLRIEAKNQHCIIGEHAFTPLEGVPFVSGAAQRLVVLFDILNALKSCFNAQGERTPEGHEMIRKFFTGRKGDGGRGAMFSDSSDTEKHEYEETLSFSHPGRPGEKIFCPFHGKVQTPQLRVHCSWPVTFDEPLYIVYVGMKLTV